MLLDDRASRAPRARQHHCGGRARFRAPATADPPPKSVCHAALTSLVAAVYISLLGALYEGIPKLETVPTLVALLASLPSAFDLIRFVRTNHDRPEIVFRAKLYAIKWHSTLGFALAASLALPRLVL